jgi:hypothetical protein
LAMRQGPYGEEKKGQYTSAQVCSGGAGVGAFHILKARSG